jgi:hypothetical protein
MKTYFKSSELPHIWAHAHENPDNPQQGRCPSSETFNGNAYQSYGTVIARIIHGKGGAVCAVLNGQNYSVTTSGHMSGVRRAVSHLPVFVLNPAKASPVDFQRGTCFDVSAVAIIDNLKAQSDDLVQQAHALRIRATTRHGLLCSARMKLEQANAAITFFGSRRKPYGFDSCVVSPDLLVKVSAAEKAEAICRENASQAEKERRARYEAFSVRRGEIFRAVHPDMASAWRAGDIDTAVETVNAGNPDYSFNKNEFLQYFPTSENGFWANSLLRVSQNGKRIETSKGAEVRTVHAALIIPLCRAANAAGKAVPADILASIPAVDTFTVNAIDAKGNLSVGCHHISLAELNILADKLTLPGDGERNPLVSAFLAS